MRSVRSGPGRDQLDGEVQPGDPPRQLVAAGRLGDRGDRQVATGGGQHVEHLPVTPWTSVPPSTTRTRRASSPTTACPARSATDRRTAPSASRAAAPGRYHDGVRSAPRFGSTTRSAGRRPNVAVLEVAQQGDAGSPGGQVVAVRRVGVHVDDVVRRQPGSDDHLDGQRTQPVGDQRSPSNVPAKSTWWPRSRATSASAAARKTWPGSDARGRRGSGSGCARGASLRVAAPSEPAIDERYCPRVRPAGVQHPGDRRDRLVRQGLHQARAGPPRPAPAGDLLAGRAQAVRGPPAVRRRPAAALVHRRRAGRAAAAACAARHRLRRARGGAQAGRHRGVQPVRVRPDQRDGLAERHRGVASTPA